MLDSESGRGSDRDLLPGLSVVITYFQSEKPLETLMVRIGNEVRALASPIQIVCVVDGPQAARALDIDVLRASMKSEDYLFVANRERRGVNASRNAGLRAATSDWVLLIDGDDDVTEGTIQAALESHLKPKQIGSAVYDISTDGSAVRKSIQPHQRRVWGFRYAGGSGMLLARDLWSQVGGFEEDLRIGGTDLEFCIRAQILANAEVRSVEGLRIIHRQPRTVTGRLRRRIRKELGHARIRRTLSGFSYSGPLQGLVSTDSMQEIETVTPVSRFRQLGSIDSIEELATRIICKIFRTCLVPFVARTPTLARGISTISTRESQ